MATSTVTSSPFSGNQEKEELSLLQDEICRAVERALLQLHPSCASTTDDSPLLDAIISSISFPNKSCRSTENLLSGKPYNIEIRIALKLYHQWRRKSTRKFTEKSDAHSTNSVTIISDLGLSRTLSSPKELAELIAPLLEEDIRNHPHWGLAPDVRCQPSGLLSLITWQRSQALRQQQNLFPCPHCIKWCKGEKGLWWHQQLNHQQEHEQATATAQATSNNQFAIVLYNINININNANAKNTFRQISQEQINLPINTDTALDPIRCIQDGNLPGLQHHIRHSNFQPASFVDPKGATPLMWAAGGGHLDMVRYLLENCHCDPLQPQKGKRSFAGRTALHWAARNGHLEVVQYLLVASSSSSSSSSSPGAADKQRQQLLEAATQDGTTAFGWACWQRHLEVMKCLCHAGCQMDGVNSFGCSPVLWCSQGTNGDGLAALQWLKEQGCLMQRVNNNGHGVLHKAAQRGQQDVGEWFVKECILNGVEDADKKQAENLLLLVGPDVEGYCPSDLAGMEGHEDFAKFLAKVEMNVCQLLNCLPQCTLPDGYCGALFVSARMGNELMCTWEKYGGLRRMKSCLMN
jgi:ankyrin repeat protein